MYAIILLKITFDLPLPGKSDNVTDAEYHFIRLIVCDNIPITLIISKWLIALISIHTAIFSLTNYIYIYKIRNSNTDSSSLDSHKVIIINELTIRFVHLHELE